MLFKLMFILAVFSGLSPAPPSFIIIGTNNGIDMDIGIPPLLLLLPLPLLTMSKASVTSGCMLSSDLKISAASYNVFPAAGSPCLPYRPARRHAHYDVFSGDVVLC